MGFGCRVSRGAAQNPDSSLTGAAQKPTTARGPRAERWRGPALPADRVQVGGRSGADPRGQVRADRGPRARGDALSYQPPGTPSWGPPFCESDLQEPGQVPSKHQSTITGRERSHLEMCWNLPRSSPAPPSGESDQSLSHLGRGHATAGYDVPHAAPSTPDPPQWGLRGPGDVHNSGVRLPKDEGPSQNRRTAPGASPSLWILTPVTTRIPTGVTEPNPEPKGRPVGAGRRVSRSGFPRSGR